MSDAQLAGRGMERMRVDAPVGYPCRVTLEDAPVGEEVLLPFVHQDSLSPFRASGPIFVRTGAEAAPVLEQLLARPDVSYLHVHFAKRGCFACRVERAAP